MAVKESIHKDEGGFFTPVHYDIHIHDEERGICVHREGRTVEEARERGWGEYAEEMGSNPDGSGESGK